MTTSGQTIIEMNRDSICNAALRKLGAIALGQTPSAQEITNATEALNNLVAELQTMGMPLWARKTELIPMTATINSFSIGVGQTVNIPFPLKILQAWTTPSAGGAIQELWPNSIDNFNRLPTNGASGTPNQYMYQPNLNYGILWVWPTPDVTTAANRDLFISYMSPFEGFVSAVDTPYFPREWNNTLIYGLTDLLAPEYGIPLNDRGMLKKEYQDHLNTALDFGLENASLYFKPTENWSHGHSR